MAEYLRVCGFKVLEASDGREARAILSAPQFQVDVVIADMQTADSGFTLLQWVRERHPPLTVLLAGTVEKAVSNAAKLCREGPDLAKPYEHRLVLERIREMLGRRDARPGE